MDNRLELTHYLMALLAAFFALGIFVVTLDRSPTPTIAVTEYPVEFAKALFKGPIVLLVVGSHLVFHGKLIVVPFVIGIPILWILPFVGSVKFRRRRSLSTILFGLGVFFYSASTLILSVLWNQLGRL